MHTRADICPNGRAGLCALALITTIAACTTCDQANDRGNDQANDRAARQSADRRSQMGDDRSPGPDENRYHGYLKGSTHVHTSGSADSVTPVHEVARWYADNGYDFIVVTDHNAITEYTTNRALLVIPGAELTHNPARCWPPPAPGGHCRIHVNSLFIEHTSAPPYTAEQTGAKPDHGPGRRGPGSISWRPRDAMWRLDMYQHALDANRALGGLAQLNHPTWYRGVDGEMLIELGRRGMRFVEIANQGFSEWNRGSDTHPSTEQLWDQALAAGVRIWGIASDDAHDYDSGDIPRAHRGHDYYPPGTGFVMVKAERRAASIRSAMERGAFYSSTGVILARIDVSAGMLSIEVASPGEHEIAFIGPGDPSSEPSSELSGEPSGAQVLARHRERMARIKIPAHGHVRAVVTDDSGRKAWVQPVFAHQGNPL